MKTIKLYGELAKRFGREFNFDVKTPGEAIRALTTTVPGLKQYLAEANGLYTIFIGYDDKLLTDYNIPFSDSEILRLVPVVTGAGSSIGRIVLGIALVVFAPTIGWAIAANYAISTTVLTGIIGGLTSLGFSLILGGVSELLFGTPEPDISSYESADNKPSYAFGGAINTTRQGNPVAVGYGRLRVGSQVISAGLYTQAVAQ